MYIHTIITINNNTEVREAALLNQFKKKNTKGC